MEQTRLNDIRVEYDNIRKRMSSGECGWDAGHPFFIERVPELFTFIEELLCYREIVIEGIRDDGDETK